MNPFSVLSADLASPNNNSSSLQQKIEDNCDQNAAFLTHLSTNLASFAYTGESAYSDPYEAAHSSRPHSQSPGPGLGSRINHSTSPSTSKHNGSGSGSGSASKSTTTPPSQSQMQGIKSNLGGREKHFSGTSTNSGSTKPESQPHSIPAGLLSPGGSAALQGKSAPVYLQELLRDKKQLQAMLAITPNLFNHIERLLDEEITRIRAALFSTLTSIGGAHGQRAATCEECLSLQQDEELDLPPPEGPVASITEKVYVPVKINPNYNFVGRLLGPRGMTAKQLEKELDCKLMVRGRGSMRDKAKEEANRGKPQWEHLSDELHVLVQVEDTENRVRLKMRRAVRAITKFLHDAAHTPDSEDELKKVQLMELAVINGSNNPSSSSGTGSVAALGTAGSALGFTGMGLSLGLPLSLPTGAALGADQAHKQLQQTNPGLKLADAAAIMAQMTNLLPIGGLSNKAPVPPAPPAANSLLNLLPNSGGLNQQQINQLLGQTPTAPLGAGQLGFGQQAGISSNPLAPALNPLANAQAHTHPVLPPSNPNAHGVQGALGAHMSASGHGSNVAASINSNTLGSLGLGMGMGLGNLASLTKQLGANLNLPTLAGFSNLQNLQNLQGLGDSALVQQLAHSASASSGRSSANAQELQMLQSQFGGASTSAALNLPSFSLPGLSGLAALTGNETLQNLQQLTSLHSIQGFGSNGSSLSELNVQALTGLPALDSTLGPMRNQQLNARAKPYYIPAPGRDQTGLHK